MLDALTYSGNRENLNAVAKDSRLSFGEGDVTDAQLVDDLMPGHDLVLVKVGPARSITSAAGPNSRNRELTENCCRPVEQTGFSRPGC